MPKFGSLFLEDDLWTPQNAYDAGHYLMVPLHAAFSWGREDWQGQFREHFVRFLESDPAQQAVWFSRLQYLYLASRFSLLSWQSQQPELIPPGLLSVLYEEVSRLWQTEPAWQWGRAPFPGGVRERLLWKLSQTQTQPSYLRAITDEELTLLAIAGDLRAVERLSGQDTTWTSVLDEMIRFSRRIFESQVVAQPGGGWLFQPGAWTDHPDYAYAGNEDIVPGMLPSKVPDIAWDTSHSHRFPLWLTSLSEGSLDLGFYDGLKAGLEEQFVARVLVPPDSSFPYFRTTNFMDGRNGVYRWNYSTLGPDQGYGPYQLSGTIWLGWWSFLDSRPIREVYRDMSSRFPPSAAALTVYVGPNTTRDRHPLVAEPGSYRNGFLELIARLASSLDAPHSLILPLPEPPDEVLGEAAWEGRTLRVDSGFVPRRLPPLSPDTARPVPESKPGQKSRTHLGGSGGSNLVPEEVAIDRLQEGSVDPPDPELPGDPLPPDFQVLIECDPPPELQPERP